MSNITKEYVDYAGLQEYDRRIKGVISTDFVGATSQADGAAGRVPAPESGDENKFLRGDGTWADPSGSSGVTGVKGAAESTYRTGNVNMTLANLGVFSGARAAWESMTAEEKAAYTIVILNDD